MNQNGKRPEPPDVSMHNANRSKFPPEELIQYAGQRVAWNPEGTKVLAHGYDVDAIIAELAARGIHFSQVVWEYIPPLEEVVFGVTEKCS